MRKVFTSRIFLLTLLLIFSLSLASYGIYRKTNGVDPNATDCCQKPPVESGNSELLWETLSRQFVSAVFFR